MKAGTATRAVVVLVLFASSALTVAARAAEETATDGQGQEGELTLYERMTSIGTVARRVFRDDEGRVTKTVYYGLRHEALDRLQGPYTEDMLEVQSIVLRVYDERGRESREEHYSPQMRLDRVKEVVYAADGAVQSVVWRTAQGVRTYEIRYADGKSISHLTFDESGDGLVSVRGVVPDDMDLVHGWGKDMHGLSCGLAANRASGTLREIYVRATVRNRGLVADEITGGQRMVLADAAGQLVPRKDERATTDGEDSRGASGEGKATLQRIKPGTAAVVVHGELARWYSDLPPGDYFLIVVCRDSDGDYSIVSNQLAITIGPSGE